MPTDLAGVPTLTIARTGGQSLHDGEYAMRYRGDGPWTPCDPEDLDPDQRFLWGLVEGLSLSGRTTESRRIELPDGDRVRVEFESHPATDGSSGYIASCWYEHN